MGFLTKQDTYERFKRLGRNSSHFVWLLAELRYFEATNGVVFAFTEVGDVTLLALEPLFPEGTDPGAVFDAGWAEFVQAANPKITAFVGVYDSFLPILKRHGFQSLRVGQEPWVDLADCIPRGNAAKGVRSARNQALHAGITVEEWTTESLSASPQKRDEIQRLLREWKGHRALDFGGFLNTTDALAHPESRRYFVASSSGGRIEGYLIATAIPGIQSYFLEDLVLSRGARRGSGELLTLEAMVALRDSGAKLASLGVVSVTSMDGQASDGLPTLVKFVTVTLPKIMRRLYNFDGLQTFRKRFKPSKWETIHLAVKTHERAGCGDERAWGKTFLSLIRAFRPRLQITASWLDQAFLRPIRKYPLTLGVFGLSLTLFAAINRFGELPSWALNRFGFSPSAPIHEWFFRSLISDYLYFNREHFAWGLVLCGMLFWAERTHRKRFIVPFVLLVSLFDDFVNYALITKPFNFFQPHIFNYLVAFKDVGGSLVLVTLVGLQLCQFRKNREILFSFSVLGLVFAYVFQAARYQSLVVNLNHFLFLCLGYIAGKLRFEYLRIESRKAAKKKAPSARCVAPRQPREKRAA